MSGISPEPATKPPNLDRALKHFFGYDSFRPGQREIIASALKQQDLLIVMPTGGGKSLCFQLPALLKPGVTVVVSPLIALMQDQVEALRNNGIGATFLNSTLSLQEMRKREQAIVQGKIKLLYVAPERLLSPRFEPLLQMLYYQVGINAFAIDEAHCVSEWGHDFRPEYRQLQLLRHRCPDVPMMALTATATQRVRQDIIEQLALKDAKVHIASFNRPNLYYDVLPKDRGSYPKLLRLIRQSNGSGIIYCLSRRQVDELAFRLQRDGIDALPYHAGMSDEERSVNQTRFIRDDVPIIVATIAFGMGINKPDVRFVVHYNLPRNIESYYQESGRAGRDGEPAQCTLFFSYGDLKTIEYIIDKKADPAEQRIARQQLRQMVNYAEGTDCRRTIQLGYFGERFAGNCANCDNCKNPQPTEDWTIEAMKFLSCVARCKERFGMNYIIDVLRGSKSQKVLRYGHDRLSTYGIGTDKTKDEWKMLGRSLIHQGLLAETTDGFSVLKLNSASWEVMRKQRSVQIAVRRKESTLSMDQRASKMAEVEMLLMMLRKLRKEIADEQSVAPYMIFQDSTLKLMAHQRPQTLSEFSEISGVVDYKVEQYGDRFVEAIQSYCEQQGWSRSPDAREAQTEDSEPVEALFEQLRILRREIADERAIAAFLVFPNSTLRQMAQQRPQTLAQLSQISGVGKQKLADYGDLFLAEIQAFCQANDLSAAIAPPDADIRTEPSYTQLQTLELHQQGMSVAEIAETRNIRPRTIIRHLSELIEMNQPVDLDRLVPPERQGQIWKALQAIGDRKLTPLREYLGDNYSFDEINLVRGLWRRELEKLDF